MQMNSLPATGFLSLKIEGELQGQYFWSLFDNNGKLLENKKVEGIETTIVFEWGLTTSYGSTAAVTLSPVTGTSDVSVSSNLTGLQSATIYHYRIKAANAVNVTYSSDMSFTTLTSAPQLTTTVPSSNTLTSAVSGGDITYDGGSPVTARGVCWSTNPGPTLSNSFNSNGTGSGSFTSNITGLTLSTVYYVRAYATNSVGTNYGNEVNFIAGIGAGYQGGIIAYILQSGDPGYIAGQTHGLIAAPGDQGTFAWGCQGVIISGADGTTIGTGNQNTLEIIAGCSEAGIAARICGDLVLGGYSDWYLPSKDELYKVFLNRVAVGGFSNGDYWSSSESNYANAWYQNFSPGYQEVGGKSFATYVRAVRGF